eukprot:TRINITY_DN28518_c0_g1_i5.p1 TRINITY_DN28518_c0_g1~~TRINITY_DN28518_c0_g1_i5.p1  ORF type:complete len:382 (-),score=64.90 TRINITY_DN28518_c0_g1_i5:230-1375(-)
MCAYHVAGESFLRRLTTLLDAAERCGALRFSLDAHAVQSGALRSFAEVGAIVLQRHVEASLRQLCAGGSPFNDVPYEAWLLTRSNDSHLSQLFELLGLDGRMRHHTRQLSAKGQASVLRSLVGELLREPNQQRQVTGSALRHELVAELALALVHLYIAEQPSWKVGEEVDAMLATQLRSGSIHGLAARLRALHEHADLPVRNRLDTTIAKVVPELSPLRLRVFVQFLQALCRPSSAAISAALEATKVGRSHSGVEEIFQARASLASSVVEAIISAKRIGALPYETDDQVMDIQQSPYLADHEKRHLLSLLVPAEMFAQGMASAASAPAHFQGSTAAVRPPSPWSRRAASAGPCHDRLRHLSPSQTPRSSTADPFAGAADVG